MNTKIITAARLIEKTRELINKNPDTVYTPGDFWNNAGEQVQACRYTKGHAAGRTGCLLAQAFVDLGVSYEDLAIHDEGGGDTITRIIEKRKIEHTERELNWLTNIQSEQDAGIPWDLALKQTDCLYPLNKTTNAQ